MTKRNATNRVRADVMRRARQTSRMTGWTGPFRGRVEDINDPQCQRRVRVRVQAMHGPKPTPGDTNLQGQQGQPPEDLEPSDIQGVPTSALPWAIVLGKDDAHDMGDFRPPPVGAKVMVEFEGGHRDFPIVTGTYFFGNVREQQTVHTVDGRASASGPVDVTLTKQPPMFESEVVKDVYEETRTLLVKAREEAITEDELVDLEALLARGPSRRVFLKSPAGHTIVTEDYEGREFMKMIDRAGQTLEFHCPVTPASNLYGLETRGTRDSTKGTQLFQEAMLNGAAWVRMKDLAGQEMILDARRGQESVRLINRNPRGSAVQRLELSAKRGEEHFEVVDARGSRFRLNAYGQYSVLIEDYKGNGFRFNTDDDKIEVNAPGGMTQNVGGNQIENILGGLVKSIGGDVDETIGNNLKQKIVGQFTKSILGNASYVIGGAMAIACAGQTSEGPVTGDAFNVTSAQGGISLMTQGAMGNIMMALMPSALGGNMTLMTSTPQQMIAIQSMGNLNLMSNTTGISMTPSSLMASCGAASINMAGGVLTLNGGAIPVNNLPACLFTGAPHGTNPMTLA